MVPAACDGGPLGSYTVRGRRVDGWPRCSVRNEYLYIVEGTVLAVVNSQVLGSP